MNIKEAVETILTDNEYARSDDHYLYLRVLEMNGHSQFTPINKIFTMVQEKEIPSFSSVSRCRRKVQEEFPLLRGRNYDRRQDAGEVVTNHIHEPEFLEQQTLF